MILVRARGKEPPLTSGVLRVQSLKILGVIVDNKLNFSEHIDTVLTSCSQSLFAFRVMRQHGMSQQSLQLVFKASILSKLIYAVPAFRGFLSVVNLTRMQSFLNRAIKFGYYPPGDPDICDIISHFEHKLFNRIALNSNHVLHYMLPDLKHAFHNLRPTTHRYNLPRKDDRNFINRMLFVDIY